MVVERRSGMVVERRSGMVVERQLGGDGGAQRRFGQTEAMTTRSAGAQERRSADVQMCRCADVQMCRKAVWANRGDDHNELSCRCAPKQDSAG